MRFNAVKPKKKQSNGFCFSKKNPAPEPTKKEIAARKKLVEQYLREKGATVCPPAYSRADF